MAMLWKGDHAEKLTLAEYQHWMLNPLPRGWAILRVPDKKKPKH
jgi:hypothetical protein